MKTTVTAIAAVLAAGLLSILPSWADARRAGEEERNRTAVTKGMDAWAAGTGSPYDLLADDVRWTITGNSLAARTYPSKDAFMSEVIRPFNARMRDRLIPMVHRYYADGDTVIVHFDARGTALDGQSYVNSYAWILRMEGERIVNAHAFFDAIAFDDLWRRVTPAANR